MSPSMRLDGLTSNCKQTNGDRYLLQVERVLTKVISSIKSQDCEGMLIGSRRRSTVSHIELIICFACGASANSCSSCARIGSPVYESSTQSDKIFNVWFSRVDLGIRKNIAIYISSIS